jgi:GPI mannosyltransferase 2
MLCQMTSVDNPALQGESRRLITIFVVWKSILLLLATLSPSPGYDTSGYILFNNGSSHEKSHVSLSVIQRLALIHLRWDALYFIKAAQRGYIYEQEWAFSRAYSLILGTLQRCTPEDINFAPSVLMLLRCFGS